MLARIRKAQDNEGGFTLIELLVVMIIIGILAAIAIPAFLNQKKKAAETSAKSDATNISRDIAAFYVDTTPTSVAVDSTSATAATTDNPNSVSIKLNALNGTTVIDTTDVKLGAHNKLSFATPPTGADFCVVVAPSLSGANTWSASNNGLFKSANCT